MYAKMSRHAVTSIVVEQPTRRSFTCRTRRRSSYLHGLWPQPSCLVPGHLETGSCLAFDMSGFCISFKLFEPQPNTGWYAKLKFGCRLPPKVEGYRLLVSWDRGAQRDGIYSSAFFSIVQISVSLETLFSVHKFPSDLNKRKFWASACMYVWMYFIPFINGNPPYLTLYFKGLSLYTNSISPNHLCPHLLACFLQ